MELGHFLDSALFSGEYSYRGLQMTETKGRGHNSGEVDATQLVSFITRIENLEVEKKAIAEDIAEMKKEAKSHGYDVKIINKVLAIRKKGVDAASEESALIETYCLALGMQPTLF